MSFTIKSKPSASELFMLALLATISAAPLYCAQVSLYSATQQKLTQELNETLLTRQIDALLEKADRVEQQGNPAIAERLYKEALTLAKNTTVAVTKKTHKVLLAYAEFLYSHRLYSRATDIYEQAERLAGLNERPFIRFAQSAYCSGNYPLALHLFKSVYDFDLEHSNADSMWPNTFEGERNALAYLYIRHNRNRDADDLYEAANISIFNDAKIDRNKELYQTSRNRLARARAAQYLQAHKTKIAIKILRSELDFLESRMPALSPPVDLTRKALAEVYLKENQNSLAEKLYLDLLKKYKNTPDQDNAHTQAAQYYWVAKQPLRTVKHLKKALAVRQKRFKADSKMIISVQTNLVIALKQVGQNGKANQLNAVLAKHEKTAGQYDEYDAANVHAYRLKETGHLAAAIKVMENQLAAWELKDSQTKGGEFGVHFNELNQMSGELADLYCEAGQLDNAQRILEKQFNQYGKKMASTPHSLVLLHLKRGRAKEAENLLLARVDETEKQYRDQLSGKPSDARSEAERLAPPYALIEANSALSEFYYRQKKFQQAATILEHQLKMMSRADEANTASSNLIVGNLALVYEKDGRLADAIYLHEEKQRTIDYTYGESSTLDPVFGFNSHGDCFTSRGIPENEYKNAAGQIRLDPGLNPYIYDYAYRAPAKKYLDLADSEDQHSIPMVDWTTWPDSDLEVQSAGGKLALFNLYQKQGNSRAAFEIRDQLYLQIQTSLTKPHVFSLAHSFPYTEFEQILKRLPKSAGRDTMLDYVEKEHQTALAD